LHGAFAESGNASELDFVALAGSAFDTNGATPLTRNPRA
jgi:hypothetical protein